MPSNLTGWWKNCLLYTSKKLTPVQLTGVKMQEYFETLLAQMERSTVDLSLIHIYHLPLPCGVDRSDHTSPNR